MVHFLDKCFSVILLMVCRIDQVGQYIYIFSKFGKSSLEKAESRKEGKPNGPYLMCNEAKVLSILAKQDTSEDWV